MAYGMSTKQRRSSQRRLAHYSAVRRAEQLIRSTGQELQELLGNVGKVEGLGGNQEKWEPTDEMRKLHSIYRSTEPKTKVEPKKKSSAF